MAFRQSDLPSRERFNYTFSNVVKVMARFAELLKLNRFAAYICDQIAAVTREFLSAIEPRAPRRDEALREA